MTNDKILKEGLQEVVELAEKANEKLHYCHKFATTRGRIEIMDALRNLDHAVGVLKALKELGQ